MAEKKSRAEYQAEYQRNYRQVKVIIDLRHPDQVEMLNWIRSKGDASNYIKSLIAEDMKKAG